jgi:hypothetical protein
MRRMAEEGKAWRANLRENSFGKDTFEVSLE